MLHTIETTATVYDATIATRMARVEAQHDCADCDDCAALAVYPLARYVRAARWLAVTAITLCAGAVAWGALAHVVVR